MNKIAIKIQNLTKIYKLYDKPIDRVKEALNLRNKKYHNEHCVLNNISMDVYKGEVLGIIGTNGSGKSTLLKMITGVLMPNSGTIEVDGRISAILELGAGFNLEYTGIENIYLNGTILGYSKQEMDKKISEIIKFAQIGEFVNQPVKTYSSGMFARLAFAVAINVDPDVLIVDEALAVGDLDFQLKCMEKFNEFREKGKTILFVSHDINSVKKYCNKTIWIKRGVIEAQGDTDIVTDKYLDSLKVSDNNEELINTVDSLGINNIGEITKVAIINSEGETEDALEYGKCIRIRLDFHMKKYIEGLVVGIAIKTIDHKYVCGLNTLLDNYKFEYQLGDNSIYLEYTKMNLIGGSYYLDVAIFESNAHVPIQHITQIKEFFVRTPYVGEGLVILDHKWEYGGGK